MKRGRRWSIASLGSFVRALSLWPTHLVLDAHPRRELSLSEVKSIERDLEVESSLLLVQLRK